MNIQYQGMSVSLYLADTYMYIIWRIALFIPIFYILVRTLKVYEKRRFKYHNYNNAEILIINFRVKCHGVFRHFQDSNVYYYIFAVFYIKTKCKWSSVHSKWCWFRLDKILAFLLPMFKHYSLSECTQNFPN